MVGCFLQLTRATDQNRPGVENSRRSTAWRRAASGAPRRAAWARASRAHCHRRPRQHDGDSGGILLRAVARATKRTCNTDRRREVRRGGAQPPHRRASSPWRTASELTATHSAHVSGWRAAVAEGLRRRAKRCRTFRRTPARGRRGERAENGRKATVSGKTTTRGVDGK